MEQTADPSFTDEGRTRQRERNVAPKKRGSDQDQSKHKRSELTCSIASKKLRFGGSHAQTNFTTLTKPKKKPPHLSDPSHNSRFTSDRISKSAPATKIPCLLLNCQSIIKKIPILKQIVSDSNAKIILLTETWINEQNLSPNELNFNQQFQLFLTNRNSKKRLGGGVAILIHKTIPCKIVFSLSFSGIEILAVDTSFKHHSVRFILIYRPPNSYTIETTKLTKIIQNHIHPHVVICGDFNFADISWSRLSAKTKTSSNFLEFVQNFQLIQHVSEPTHIHGNTLDLCISNSPELVTNLSIKPGLSDHHSIYFHIKASPIKHTPTKIPSFSLKNITKLKPSLTFLSPILTHFFTSADKYNAFYDFLNQAIQKFIPYHNISSKPNKINYPPHIKSILNKKALLFRLAKTDPTLKKSYIQLSKTAKSLIIQHHKTSIRKTLSSQSKLYSYLRKFTNNYQNYSLEINQELISDIPSICEIFADTFFKSFQNIPLHNPSPIHCPHTKTIDDIDFDVVKVSHILQHLPNKLNSSPDNLNFRLLKNCHLELTPILSDLFRLSMDTCFIPDIWKCSHIVPIPKKGNKHDPSNYRPISITSSLCRIMEKIIYAQLLHFLNSVKFFDINQFGFLKGRSTTLQLISSIHIWFKSIIEKQSIHTIYVDFKKAFDSVPHRFLIYKLSQIGIRGKLLAWFTNYLKNRKFTVKIQNHQSSPRNISSGVPQGSVLSPLLFLIYVNDLPSNVNPTIQIKLFADDLKLFKSTSINHTDHALQNALNSIHQWSLIWALPISIEKSCLLHIGNPTSNIVYHINNQPLYPQESITDLGILIDNKLLFHQHISIIVKKAYYRSYQLTRVLNSSNPSIWSQAFKLYIRPLLEYGSEIWSPANRKLIDKIENVQKYFTRTALFKSKRIQLPYNQRLKIFNLTTLEIRRKVIDLTTLFRICRHLTHLNPHEIISFSNRPARRHPFQIIAPHKTSKTQNSFLNRNINLWNTLPSSLFNTNSPKHFSKSVNTHLAMSQNSIFLYYR